MWFVSLLLASSSHLCLRILCWIISHPRNKRFKFLRVSSDDIASMYAPSWFFFFSSRRRHTRYWRDWSSDVCSSDLVPEGRQHPRRVVRHEAAACPFLLREVLLDPMPDVRGATPEARRHRLDHHAPTFGRRESRERSEERRVGKECRSRWSPYH